jgi:DNA-binding transcriptional MerR regulator
VTRLLSTSAAAEILAVPAGTLRYWRKVGVGPSWLKLEGTIRYDFRDLQEYVEQCRHQPSVRAHVEAKRHAL